MTCLYAIKKRKKPAPYGLALQHLCNCLLSHWIGSPMKKAVLFREQICFKVVPTLLWNIRNVFLSLAPSLIFLAAHFRLNLFEKGVNRWSLTESKLSKAPSNRRWTFSCHLLDGWGYFCSSVQTLQNILLTREDTKMRINL